MRLMRSLIRIVAAVVLRQPALTALPFRGSARADAQALQTHVRFLANDVRPRSAAHPENLDRAAAYIADAFRAAGARRVFNAVLHLQPVAPRRCSAENRPTARRLPSFLTSG